MTLTEGFDRNWRATDVNWSQLFFCKHTLMSLPCKRGFVLQWCNCPGHFDDKSYRCFCLNIWCGCGFTGCFLRKQDRKLSKVISWTWHWNKHVYQQTLRFCPLLYLIVLCYTSKIKFGAGLKTSLDNSMITIMKNVLRTIKLGKHWYFHFLTRQRKPYFSCG